MQQLAGKTKLNLGPYRAENGFLSYKGNRRYKPLKEVRNILPPSFKNRLALIKDNRQPYGALIRLWDAVFQASRDFMKLRNSLFIDLPITTRMISSPGALAHTIISDTKPFKVKFFNYELFLTQSSQLYLEFAIMNPKIKSVYCWEKSFRCERADFRHLPEFTHIEFEAAHNFQKNLQSQQQYLQFIIKRLVEECRSELLFFLDQKDVEQLRYLTQLKTFAVITFTDAFKLLRDYSGNLKYNSPTVKNFSAHEEVLLTQIIGRPVFVTHYVGDEVAFYHAPNRQQPTLVDNADLLYPGYGELIGSGERAHTRAEVLRKARHFKLDFNDYRSYIQSRSSRKPIVHAGWGMGIERFLQAILKLPFIWETKPFPRVHNQLEP